MIDYTQEPVLIVQISDLPNTSIKRYFKVNQQTATFNLNNPQIEIGGYVIHKLISVINGVSTEIDTPGVQTYYKKFVANNNEKVNEEGRLDENGTIGQYNWIYWSTYNKVISPQEAIIGAVLEADTLNKFNQ